MDPLLMSANEKITLNLVVQIVNCAIKINVV